MVLHKIKDKWKRNVAIYKDAYKKGKIAGFDYTLLLWKVHTKFLLRIRNPKDRQKVFERLEKFWEGFADVIESKNVTILEKWITGDVRPNRGDEKWLNLLLKKK